jgi:amino acid adenylation domain-containing protein
MSRDHAASSLSAEAKRDLLAQLLRGRATAPEAPAAAAAPVPPVRPPAAIRRSAATGPRPLSFAQHRLWFFDQLMPGTAIYNIHVGLRLAGGLDVAALTAALGEIVRRHEALRTRFAAEDGTPFQIVMDAGAAPLATTDLRHLPPPARDAEARRLAESEAARPFDLSSGPLFRTSLVRLDDDKHLLLVTMHHIISDGLSGAIVIRELAALYGQAADGRALAELPIQYADFAEWQRGQFGSGAVFDRQLAFWTKRLAGDLPVLDLPTDFPRGGAQTFRGATAAVILPEALVGQLKALSREQGATLFMTMLAAFQLLLSRQSGQEDVIVGFPVSGRSRPECEPVIGCFINTLALRTDLSGRPAFVELLARVRRGALEAYANQDVPFDKIVEELNPERDRSRTPVFQVLFNMLGGGNSWFTSFGDIRVEPAAPLAEPSKFDLTLYAGDIGSTVYLRAVYNADLFAPARIDELIAQFVHLLEQVVAAPSQSIASYSLVTAAARVRLPDITAALDSTWDGFVHDRVAEHARRTPDRVAVSHAGTTWTYAELDRLSDSVATRLAAGGIGAEAVVCVYAGRSPELVAALLGIWKCGAAFLVLDPSYPAPRLRAYVAAAQPQACISTASRAAALHEVIDGIDLRCSFELEGKDGLGDPAEDVPTPRRDIGADQLAYVAFTSGSSGAPKGILGVHRPVSHFLAWHAERFGLTSADRFSMLSGLAHDPLLRDIFTPLWVGASLHIPGASAFDSGDRLAGWLRSEAVTVAHLTPPMAQLLCQSSDRAALPLRHAFFGGEALTTRDVAALRTLAPAVRCVNFYGATETPQAIAFCDVDADLRARPLRPDDRPRVHPVGRGIAGVQLALLNEAGGLAGIGELAEICVRTPYLARGYAGATAEDTGRFTINPATGTAGDRLYRTNDLGRYRPDGLVEWHGRRDGQVKLRGFRIELGEVESVLMEHPDIAQAAALLSQDTGDARLIAYCVARDAEPAAAALRAWLRARLPEYMVPATFVFLAGVPRTPNGKVDRRRLPVPAAASAQTHGDTAAPLSPVEQALAEVWSGLLRVERIGADANFFDIGGHSLLATQLVSRIREVFDIELPLRRVFDTPTIAGLALAITQSLMDEDEAAGDPAAAGRVVRG